MKTSKWGIAMILSIALLAAARGEMLTYDIRGTLDSLTDPTHYFGQPGAGASFELTYLADYSRGDRGGGGGSFGSSNYLTGGTIYEPDFPGSDYTVSPISATLTVNGRALVFPGEYLGRVFYVESFTSGFSRAELTAQSSPDQEGTARNQINMRFVSLDPLTFGSVDTLGAWVIDGQSITGAGDFTSCAPDSSTGSCVAGELHPTTFEVVSAVAEPSNAGLLLAGLFGLAWVVLRRPCLPLRVARCMACRETSAIKFRMV